MITIDEIRIEGDEDGFHLIVYTDDPPTVMGAPPGPMRFRIGLPDQFHAEVERTIGRWLAEGETARNHWTPEDLRGPDLPLNDSKHPNYHDTMSAIHDNREGK